MQNNALSDLEKENIQSGIGVGESVTEEMTIHLGSRVDQFQVERAEKTIQEGKNINKSIEALDYVADKDVWRGEAGKVSTSGGCWLPR